MAHLLGAAFVVWALYWIIRMVEQAKEREYNDHWKCPFCEKPYSDCDCDDVTK